MQTAARDIRINFGHGLLDCQSVTLFPQRQRSHHVSQCFHRCVQNIPLPFTGIHDFRSYDVEYRCKKRQVKRYLRPLYLLTSRRL